MTIFRKITPPILILLISEILLILLFPGSLIFESTLTAGGDTPSHFTSAVAMSRGLLALFSPVTWMHGAYAGYPLFLHYFPLPFTLMAIISKAVSLQIAFKLVTLLAIIPLPAAVYLCLRLLGYGQNIPAIGAVLSLPFLLMTENSMWGGNICSTLSGEFAFAISFILYIIFTGKLYADIAGGKSPLGNSIVEALIALSHGYPLLQSIMGSSYFILWGRNLRFILQLHVAAAGFAAFWLLPFLWRIHWNTPYSYCWRFESWAEIAPPVLWPSFAGVLILACSRLRNLFGRGKKLSCVFRESIECPELYLLWQFGVALLGFSLASCMGLVDNRFLPFAQIMLVLLGAVGWGRLLSHLPRHNLWLAGFCAGVVALALTKAAFVDSWIQWNYSGMESKPLWNSFLLLNEYLSGDENSPRVVFEHNAITNEAGSTRSFELLPYYSGRSTLEGLYMQSGLNSPFIFYMQSELTEIPSVPFPLYYYSRPNPDRAAAHMRLFNVSQVIAASDNITNALDSSPDYELGIVVPPYRVYRLKGCGDSYVEPLRFRPLRIPPHGWKERQYDWFRKSSLRVPLVVASEDAPGDFWKNLQTYEGDPEHIPEVPIQEDEQIRAHALLGDGKITIDTSKPGHPLWIKVSYHPDWRITEGAGDLYLASPAFMLLVPKTCQVVLTFDTGAGIYLWGKVLFFLTILVFIFKTPVLKIYRRQRASRGKSRSDNRARQSLKGIGTNAGFFVAFALMAAIILGAISTRNHRDPVLLYNLAADKFNRISESASNSVGPAFYDSPAFSISPETLRVYDLLNEGIEKFGHSPVSDFSMMYKASLMSSWKRWDDLRPMLEDFLKDNPENRIYAESLTWLGEAALQKGREARAEMFFRQALSTWPYNKATERAGLHLAEMIGADTLLETAHEFRASGRYMGVYNIYRALTLSEDKKIADQSVISLAYCSFYMNRWQEASDLFIKWLSDNFDAPESARVQADYRRCQAIIDQNKQWMPGIDGRSNSSARSGLLVRLLNWVEGRSGSVGFSHEDGSWSEDGGIQRTKNKENE
jgi:tetratricopeptide (TPR) repeat protein